jgi:hypothetical protein
MIYLFALFLISSVPDAKDARWMNGSYTEGTFVFETIAGCEAKRVFIIQQVMKNEHKAFVSARVSKCAAAKEAVEYNIFTPKPAPPVSEPDLKGDKS